MTTFLHGIIAGGTAAYLHRDTKVAAEQKLPQLWTRVAMQANHILLILGVIVKQTGLPRETFALVAKNVFILTPVVTACELACKKSSSPTEAALASKCSQVYFVTVAVCSVALFVLGNRAFGVASLSMLALNTFETQGILSSMPRKMWHWITGGTAILGRVGFSAWIIADNTTTTQLALVATAVLRLISALPARDQTVNPSKTSEQKSSSSQNDADASTPSSGRSSPTHFRYSRTSRNTYSRDSSGSNSPTDSPTQTRSSWVTSFASTFSTAPAFVNQT